ncbi:SDR family NAD(P)-dependent oxidoreductase [Terriglobus albidus]|uniref:SDR family NAD(P)-dependent oxidoreductase n=1 Tax=Terriglobus albidus TaxID=1592106 RepID=A0A5B9E9P6_9BACT|nr:SDR family oxidoreductase [Terriglobus albidus]QEE27027.1 SDR family NAD(P)-dependent oxidoreductase [Terriglobus albidus]
MKVTGNTILITGGGSGLGRGLAEAFHKRGNTVIIAGRRKEVLDQVGAANPGIVGVQLDVQSEASINAFAADLAAKYPALNVLINMAGIMKTEQVIDPKAAEETINTNLLAPIRLTAALLPTLQKQPSATIMNVSSGLAFTPLALTPTYSATKAAIHSWSQSLRYQLKGTSVEVLELAPPYVQTELLGPHQKSDPRAMPLDAFIDETMQILETQPQAKEILVKNVHPLRFAGDFNAEKFDAWFEQFNTLLAGH